MFGTTDKTVGAADRMVGTTDKTVGAADGMVEAHDDVSWYHEAATDKGSRVHLSSGSERNTSGYCAMMSPTSLIIMVTLEIVAPEMVTLFTHELMKPEMVMPMIIIIYSFYTELFSALEQTHCAHWHVILNE